MRGGIGGFLEEIVASRAQGHFARDGRDRVGVAGMCAGPPPVGALAPRTEAVATLRARLRSAPASPPCVFAEIKRASPSRGVMRADLDAAGVAREYVEAGAVAVSVLTEPRFFGGSLQDLYTVRRAVGIPVLRKDFIVDLEQLEESREWGADLVLLIVALLGRSTKRFVERARELGLEPLVEAHESHELDAALESGAELVGVNNRNLRTLVTDLEVSRRLLPLIPSDRSAVCESGLRDRSDLIEMTALGAHGFLVGEALVCGRSPGESLATLIGARPRRIKREGSSV